MATDYTYLIARLRALEADMPDAAWFQRLARSSSGGILTMMREYYHGFEGIGSIEEYETGLEAERASFMKFISSLIDDASTLSFLRSGYDFDNALHAWKAKKLGGQPTSSDAGLVGAELVEKAVAENDWKSLPDHIRNLLGVIDTVGEKEEPAFVQYAGEVLKYRFLLDTAPDETAKGYMRCKVDLMNIQILIRLKRSKLRLTEPERAFLEGGGIETGRMASFMKESEEEFYSFLKMSDYRGLLLLGLGAEAPLWRIGAAARLFILETLGESRLRFFDFSPVLYHVELRDRNEHITRIVLVGKLNGIPEDVILERVEALLPS
jgi:V/A-type H+-transporting ATPase subunit C